MTSNALKSAILLDAMAAIVPDFDAEGDDLARARKTFTIRFVYHFFAYREAQGGGEMRVLEAGKDLDTYRGASPSFVGALDDMRRTAAASTGERSWTQNTCASIDKDGDELITVFDIELRPQSRRYDGPAIR